MPVFFNFSHCLVENKKTDTNAQFNVKLKRQKHLIKLLLITSQAILFYYKFPSLSSVIIKISLILHISTYAIWNRISIKIILFIWFFYTFEKKLWSWESKYYIITEKIQSCLSLSTKILQSCSLILFFHLFHKSFSKSILRIFLFSSFDLL